MAASGRRLRRIAREARVAVPGEWLGWARAARRGWQWRDDTLVRELTFRDFDEGDALPRAGGAGSTGLHAPAGHVDIGQPIRLKIANPHQAGISLAGLRLAAKVNAVVDEFGAMADGVS